MVVFLTVEEDSRHRLARVGLGDDRFVNWYPGEDFELEQKLETRLTVTNYRRFAVSSVVPSLLEDVSEFSRPKSDAEADHLTLTLPHSRRRLLPRHD